MYVVAGVTGKTGSATANHLLERGQNIRVIVRKAEQGEAWARRGAEVAVASLTDAEALRAALKGAHGAYLLLPVNFASTQVLADLARMTEALRTALERMPVPRVVLLSSVGAHLPKGTGPIRALYHLEQELGMRQGLTYLRPCYFMENWGMSLAPAAEQGKIFSFSPPEVAFPMVSTTDIGMAATELLLQPEAVERVQLVGPQLYSAQDVANALKELLHREVEPVFVDSEHTVQTLEGVGASTDMAKLYKEMNAGFASGTITFAGNEFAKQGSTSLHQALAKLLA